MTLDDPGVHKARQRALFRFNRNRRMPGKAVARTVAAETRRVLDRKDIQTRNPRRRTRRRPLHNLLRRHLAVPQKPPNPNRHRDDLRSHTTPGDTTDSAHVIDVGMPEADDRAVWNFAIENRFVIDSKDGDFRQLGFVAGAPPKVVRVRMGDCSTAEIVAALRRRACDLHVFQTAREAALPVIA